MSIESFEYRILALHIFHLWTKFWFGLDKTLPQPTRIEKQLKALVNSLVQTYQGKWKIMTKDQIDKAMKSH
jgi:hypothetical protein